MSEIEKMYKNTGLSNMWVERYNDGYYEHENYYDSYKEMINNMMKVNDWTLTEAQEVAKRECSKEFPPFTAEKQLELIKWLAYKMHITIGKGLPWGQYDDDWWTVTDKKGYVGTNAYKLEEALANFVNSLWQLLTEKEKQQVKGILE